MTHPKIAKRPPTIRDRHPVLIRAEAAMKRAGERARRLAAETTGELVVFENGRIVCVPVPRTEAPESLTASEGENHENQRTASAGPCGPEAETPDRGGEEIPESR